MAGLDLMALPAIIVSSPETLTEIENLANKCREWRVATLFIEFSELGLNPLVSASIFDQRLIDTAIGLCIHGRDKNGTALDCDIRTAQELGILNYFLKEANYEGFDVSQAVNTESSLSIIEMIRKYSRQDSTIVVENAFLHSSDFKLLKSQIEEGADLVASPFANGHLSYKASKFADLSLKLLMPEAIETETYSKENDKCIVDLTGLSGEVVTGLGDKLFR